MSHIATFVTKTAFLNISIFIFMSSSISLSTNALAQTFITQVSSPATQVNQEEQRHSTQIYDFTMDDIDGNPLPLETFKGKVVLVVNTASFCGNTPQYEGLQTLYEQYRDQGFTILAFPANDFGRQEPGDNQEIAEFCYTKYSLEFPLFSKITVLGDQKHPLYRYLTEHTAFKGEIKWNFQKFLISKDGTVIARYRPSQKPLSKLIVHDVKEALQNS